MHRLLRNTHLLLGLFCGLFLLMYGASAVQMAHNNWFTPRPHVDSTTVTLGAGLADARVVARALMDRDVVEGEVAQVATKPGHLTFRVVRPGTTSDVDYDATTGTATVHQTRAAFVGMLNRLHHAAGLNHGYAPLNMWGALIGVVSVGLFILGLTGVYLWFKLHQERVIGVILLGICLACTLPLLVSLRLAW